MTDPLVIIRAIHIAATAMLAGLIAFELLIARPVLAQAKDAATKRYLARVGGLVWVMLVVALLSGPAWAGLLAAQVVGEPLARALTDGTLTKLLTDTHFGGVWLARFVVAVALACLLLFARGRIAKWLGFAAAAFLLAALSLVSHAYAQLASGWAALLLDTGHALAAGLWLGSLPALALLLAGHGPPELAAAATRRFSSLGMVAVAVLFASGVLNGWRFLDGSLAALTGSSYGHLLIAKAALFVAMAALASINRWALMPRLPSAATAGTISLLSLTEIALGLAAVLIVGALETTAPPMPDHFHANSSVEAAFTHLHDIGGMADITIRPGHTGPSDITLHLMREDFSPLAVTGVAVRLQHDHGPVLQGEARPGPDEGTWVISGLPLAPAGIWTVTIEAATAAGKKFSLEGPVVIDP